MGRFAAACILGGSFATNAIADILPSIVGMKPQAIVVNTTGDAIANPVTIFVKRFAQQCGIHNCVNFCNDGASARIDRAVPITLTLPAVSAGQVRQLGGFFLDAVAYSRGMCAATVRRDTDGNSRITVRLVTDNGPPEHRLLHLANYPRALQCDHGDYGPHSEQRMEEVQAAILAEASSAASTDYEKFLARKIANQFLDGRPDYREDQRLVGGREYALLWRHVKEQEIDWAQPNHVTFSTIPIVDPTLAAPPQPAPAIPTIVTASGQRVTSGRGPQPMAVDENKPPKMTRVAIVPVGFAPPAVLCRADLQGRCRLDRRDANGKTHLYRAMEAGDAGDAWALLLAGADPEIEPYPGGGTALDILMEKGLGRFDIGSARQLLAAFKANGRATVNARYEKWKTSSGPAAQSGETGDFFVAVRETIASMALRKIFEPSCPRDHVGPYR